MFTHTSADDLLRLWPTATDAGWDDEMNQALHAAAQLQEVPPAHGGGRPSQAPVATPAAAHHWATWPASPQVWPPDTMPSAAAMPRHPVPVAPVFGPGVTMSTLAPEDLAAINAHLKAQAARREQQQGPGSSLAASAGLPSLPGRAPMSLSDAIMMDLRPIVAQRPNPGAAARAIPVQAAVPSASDAPPPPAAPAPAAHAGPLRMRTASAKAVAAAETEQLLGQLDKATPPEAPPVAPAPAAPPPASGAPAEPPPKPRGGAPPSPKSGGPKRQRGNSVSAGAAGGGGGTDDTGEEAESSEDDGAGIDGAADPRRQRRVLSNRESARRSRRRKMERLQELASERDAARQECAVLRAALLAAGIPLPDAAAETEAKAKDDNAPSATAGQVVEPPKAAAKEVAEAQQAAPFDEPAPAVHTPLPPSARVTRAAQAAQTRAGMTTRSGRKPAQPQRKPRLAAT